MQDAGHLSGGSKAYEMAELTHEDEDVALYARPDAAGVELAVQAGSANEIVTGRKQANRPDLDWAHMMALNAFWFGYTVYGFVVCFLSFFFSGFSFVYSRLSSDACHCRSQPGQGAYRRGG